MSNMQSTFYTIVGPGGPLQTLPFASPAMAADYFATFVDCMADMPSWSGHIHQRVDFYYRLATPGEVAAWWRRWSGRPRRSADGDYYQLVLVFDDTPTVGGQQ
jgi:hypothetical protein